MGNQRPRNAICGFGCFDNEKEREAKSQFRMETSNGKVNWSGAPKTNDWLTCAFLVSNFFLSCQVKTKILGRLGWTHRWSMNHAWGVWHKALVMHMSSVGHYRSCFFLFFFGFFSLTCYCIFIFLYFNLPDQIKLRKWSCKRRKRNKGRRLLLSIYIKTLNPQEKLEFASFFNRNIPVTYLRNVWPTMSFSQYFDKYLKIGYFESRWRMSAFKIFDF